MHTQNTEKQQQKSQSQSVIAFDTFTHFTIVLNSFCMFLTAKTRRFAFVNDARLTSFAHTQTTVTALHV